MASYSAEQLSGAGVATEELSGNKTFTLTNPSSGSAYFTIETTRNNQGFYDSTTSTNTIGTYGGFVLIDEDTLVTSSYIASVVVPSGEGVFEFEPDNTVTAGSALLRATGGISLVIS